MELISKYYWLTSSEICWFSALILAIKVLYVLPAFRSRNVSTYFGSQVFPCNGNENEVFYRHWRQVEAPIPWRWMATQNITRLREYLVESLLNVFFHRYQILWGTADPFLLWLHEKALQLSDDTGEWCELFFPYTCELIISLPNGMLCHLPPPKLFLPFKVLFPIQIAECPLAPSRNQFLVL